MFAKKKKKKGFTLIELLVVIAIIGILAGIVLVSLSGAQKRAKDARITADMNQIRTGAEVFYGNQSPNTYTGLAADSGITPLTADVTAQGGTPTIVVNALGTGYCAYGTLVGSTGNSWCVDNALHSKQYTTAAVSAAGTCGGACAAANSCKCE